MSLLARVDGKIILDRVSEKRDMAIWTTLIQREGGNQYRARVNTAMKNWVQLDRGSLLIGRVTRKNAI